MASNTLFAPPIRSTASTACAWWKLKIPRWCCVNAASNGIITAVVASKGRSCIYVRSASNGSSSKISCLWSSRRARWKLTTWRCQGLQNTTFRTSSCTCSWQIDGYRQVSTVRECWTNWSRLWSTSFRWRPVRSASSWGNWANDVSKPSPRTSYSYTSRNRKGCWNQCLWLPPRSQTTSPILKLIYNTTRRWMSTYGQHSHSSVTRQRCHSADLQRHSTGKKTFSNWRIMQQKRKWTVCCRPTTHTHNSSTSGRGENKSDWSSRSNKSRRIHVL